MNTRTISSRGQNKKYKYSKKVVNENENVLFSVLQRDISSYSKKRGLNRNTR